MNPFSSLIHASSIIKEVEVRQSCPVAYQRKLARVETSAVRFHTAWDVPGVGYFAREEVIAAFKISNTYLHNLTAASNKGRSWPNVWLLLLRIFATHEKEFRDVASDESVESPASLRAIRQKYQLTLADLALVTRFDAGALQRLESEEMAATLNRNHQLFMKLLRDYPRLILLSWLSLSEAEEPSQDLENLKAQVRSLLKGRLRA
jgi:hypothetical protein